MNKIKSAIFLCSFASILFATTAMAANIDAAASQPINVSVGNNFSIKLADNKNCGIVKAYDNTNLLINGIETGMHPLGCDPTSDELIFSLKKDDASASLGSKAAWEAILGHPWDTVKSSFKRELRYTVTQATDVTGQQILSTGKLKLNIANTDIGLIGAVLVAALWIALFYLGRNSGMLRDDGNQGSTVQSRTYSLSRVQMAWWFGIIMGSYIFLWMLSHEMPTLGSQALLLMGISGATGLTAASLNAGMQKQMPVSSGNFFDDLLTDAYGVTLHRFQMLAITVILGVMFIIHVATNLTMPEFDGTLLTLMGIAGGTYIGFKIPESHVATDDIATVEEHKAGYMPEPETTDNK
jgi:hypothetical protein